MALHVSRDPMGDQRAYVTLFYRENVGTGQREYFAPETGSMALEPALVDQRGNPAGAMRARPLEPGRRLGAWTGPVPEAAGLWEFVVELWEPSLDRVIKRARARFVVTGSEPEVVGAGGAAVEVTGQTRWVRDRIYRLRGPVRVRAGGAGWRSYGAGVRRWRPRGERCRWRSWTRVSRWRGCRRTRARATGSRSAAAASAADYCATSEVAGPGRAAGAGAVQRDHASGPAGRDRPVCGCDPARP